MLLQGNHKSEKSDLNVVVMEKEIDKEVEHGRALTITIESIQHIKYLGVVPLGVSKKLPINKKGEHYTKIRVIHDCYFPGTSGLSTNNRVLRDTPQPCFHVF